MLYACRGPGNAEVGKNDLYCKDAVSLQEKDGDGSSSSNSIRSSNSSSCKVYFTSHKHNKKTNITKKKKHYTKIVRRQGTSNNCKIIQVQMFIVKRSANKSKTKKI